MEKRRRTREEVVLEAFKSMYRDGDLELHHAVIPLRTGGVLDKVFYRVKPLYRNEIDYGTQ